MNKKNIVLWLVLLLELIILGILINLIIYYDLFRFMNDINKFSKFIISFGIFSPIIFIFVQIIQVALFVIPGEVTGFIGGYLFGAFAGTVYTTIGVFIGSIIAFALARRFGRPFVKKMIGQKYLDKLDSYSPTKITIIFFLIFLLPLFPDDIFCFLAGITKMRFRIFALIVLIGRFPGYLMLGMLGAGVANSQMNMFILLSVITLIFVLFMYLFRNKLEKYFRI